METQIERITQKLFAIDNCSQLIKEIVIDQTIDFTEMLTRIFNNADKINNEEKIVYLSKFIAGFSTKNKFLSDFEQQVTSVLNNDSNFSEKNYK